MQRFWSVILAVIVTCSWVGAEARAQIEPVEARPAWAVAPISDGVMIVPLVPATGATDPLLASTRSWAPKNPEVRTPNGDRATTRLHRLVARTPLESIAAARGDGAGWMAPALRWIEAPDDEPITTPSIWLLEVRNVSPGTLTIGRRSLTLFDAPAPHRARARAPASNVFARAIAPIDASPTERWRAGWIGAARAGSLGEAPLVIGWSDAIGARWDEAMRRLIDADPIVARRVEHRLVAIADPHGAPLPVWVRDRAEDRALLEELLSPGMGDGSLVSAGEAWLERTARAIVWVADDAPLVDEGQLWSADLGIVSLSALPFTPSLTSERGPARLTPAIEPGPVPVFARLAMDNERSSDIAIASVGPWTSRFAVITAPLLVTPPGLTTGDFVFDETRETFGTGTVPPARGARTRAALTRLEPGSWQLVVECERADAGADTRVSLWLGPRGSRAPSARVSTDGSRTGALVRTWSRLEDGRLLAGFVFTERDHLDPDGLLRLAIVREDVDGARSAWPRPMVPGQREPGRIAVDPSAWVSPDG